MAGGRTVPFALRMRPACSGSAVVGVGYEEYHPFGTTSWWATASGTGVSAKRYRYTGKERDDETGLGYHGARYYAVWLGRWERPDPAGMGDGPNRYAYCRGNPVGGRDPSGTATRDTDLEFRELQRRPSQPRLADDLVRENEPKVGSDLSYIHEALKLPILETSLLPTNTFDNPVTGNALFIVLSSSQENFGVVAHEATHAFLLTHADDPEVAKGFSALASHFEGQNWEGDGNEPYQITASDSDVAAHEAVASYVERVVLAQVNASESVMLAAEYSKESGDSSTFAAELTRARAKYQGELDAEVHGTQKTWTAGEYHTPAITEEAKDWADEVILKGVPEFDDIPAVADLLAKVQP